jgi:hypothetical protein
MKVFPSTEPIYGNDVIGVKENSGMDLRDYIATNAMQGMLSNPEFLQVVTKEEVNGSDCASRVAKVSYKYADAMMKAREQ